MAALRVLIVDDNELSRKALVTLFSRQGWEALEAATVAEGLERLDPLPEAIVLDLNLTDGDGETILRRIRAEEHSTLVVVATAEDDASRLGNVAELKPDLLVHKPIDWEVIWRYCDTQLRRSDAGEPAG